MLGFLFGFAQIHSSDIPAGIMPKRQQAVGTGLTSSTSTPVSSPSPSSSSTSPSSSDTPTSSTDPGTTSSSTPVPTSSDVPPTTSSESTPSSTTSTSSSSTISSSSEVTPSSSSIDRSTISSSTTVTTPLITSHTVSSTYTSFVTSGGRTLTSTGVTNQVVPTTTGYAYATLGPSSSSSNSISPASKKIIGGVVGGVGGFILLGGLALVAWRLWGRKHRQGAAQDEFMHSRDDSIQREKRNSLQPVLAGYRNPNGEVNTASNF